MSQVNQRDGQDPVPSPEPQSLGGLSSAMPRNDTTSTGVTGAQGNQMNFKKQLKDLERPDLRRLESTKEKFLRATNLYHWSTLFKIDVDAPEVQTRLDPLFQVQTGIAAQICGQEQIRVSPSRRQSGGREHTTDLETHERISVPLSWNAQHFLDQRVKAWLQRALPTQVEVPKIHIEWHPKDAVSFRIFLAPY